MKCDVRGQRNCLSPVACWELRIMWITFVCTGIMVDSVARRATSPRLSPVDKLNCEGAYDWGVYMIELRAVDIHLV